VETLKGIKMGKNTKTYSIMLSLLSTLYYISIEFVTEPCKEKNCPDSNHRPITSANQVDCILLLVTDFANIFHLGQFVVIKNYWQFSGHFYLLTYEARRGLEHLITLLK
jgi:hypothetical protein